MLYSKRKIKSYSIMGTIVSPDKNTTQLVQGLGVRAITGEGFPMAGAISYKGVPGIGTSIGGIQGPCKIPSSWPLVSLE